MNCTIASVIPPTRRYTTIYTVSWHGSSLCRWGCDRRTCEPRYMCSRGDQDCLALCISLPHERGCWGREACGQHVPQLVTSFEQALFGRGPVDTTISHRDAVLELRQV